MFDETGERIDAGGAAVYVLLGGAHWCMLAESNGEAILFDAPEGMGSSDAKALLVCAKCALLLYTLTAPSTCTAAVKSSIPVAFQPTGRFTCTILVRYVWHVFATCVVWESECTRGKRNLL